jgi:hypothetical protein
MHGLALVHALVRGALTLHAPPILSALGSRPAAIFVNLHLLLIALCGKLLHLCPQGTDLFA